jgi:integrase
VRERSPGRWEVRAALPPDPATGRRKVHTETLRGNRREAERRLRAVLTEIDQGARVDRSKTTIGRLVRESIEQWRAARRISARTAEQYSELAEAYVIPHLGACAIQQLTTRHLEEWHGELLRSGGRRGGVSTRTVAHSHRLLAQALTRAQKHGWIARNVARLERPPQVQTREMQILRADQVTQLLAALEGEELRTVTLTLLHTGMRRAEALALRWASVDLDRSSAVVCEALEELRDGTITVKRPKTDAGARTISLSPTLVQALHAHRATLLEHRIALGRKRPENDLVFPGPDGGHPSPRRLSVRCGARWPGSAWPTSASTP